MSREQDAFDRAMKASWEMVVPHPSWAAGSYNAGHNNGVVAALRTVRENYEREAALSQPQAASSTQAGESLAERLQRQCVEWGAYWRAPDAHGVILTPEQAAELLRDALGVEVEITASSTTPGSSPCPTPSACRFHDECLAGSTGAVDALPAKWRERTAEFDKGLHPEDTVAANCYRICADELEAALAQPAQQGER